MIGTVASGGVNIHYHPKAHRDGPNRFLLSISVQLYWRAFAHEILQRISSMKLAYLLSEYPTLVHTYLLREVRQLRVMGVEIQTLSVRRPDLSAAPPSAEEKAERDVTWYLLGSGLGQHLAEHASTVLTRPLGYIRGLRLALWFGRFHPRRTLLAMAYFAEAVLAGQRITRAGITHLHSVYSTTVALILSRIFEVHLSITLHGSAEFINPDSFALSQKVEAAESICAISEYGRSQIMLWSPARDWRKVHVTPLGVNVEDWVQAEFRQNPSPFELITVGRLVETKGLPLLLEAVSALVKQGRNVRLTLVGDGPDRAALETLAARLGIQDNIVFEGWKDQERLAQYYRQSDVFVMASFAEGIPVVMMEAMATGVPCVAPRITGIPELVRDGKDGILFTASNVEELVDGVARMMDDPAMRRSMAESSRARIGEKYDLQKNVERLATVFNRWMGCDN